MTTIKLSKVDQLAKFDEDVIALLKVKPLVTAAVANLTGITRELATMRLARMEKQGLITSIKKHKATSTWFLPNEGTTLEKLEYTYLDYKVKEHEYKILEVIGKGSFTTTEVAIKAQLSARKTSKTLAILEKRNIVSVSRYKGRAGYWSIPAYKTSQTGSSVVSRSYSGPILTRLVPNCIDWNIVDRLMQRSLSE